MPYLPVLLFLKALYATRSDTLNTEQPSVLHPNVTCCNGGVPYFDNAAWSIEDGAFQAVTVHQKEHDPSTQYSCQMYVLKALAWNSAQGKYGTRSRSGTMACKCTKDFYGDSCTTKREAQSWNSGDGQSFKMFLLLAVVPLTFALLAAVGGLFCRMCCCHIIGFECFNFKWHFGGFKEDLDCMEDSYDASMRTRTWQPAGQEPIDSQPSSLTWITEGQRQSDSAYYGPPPSYETVVQDAERRQTAGNYAVPILPL